MKKINLLFPLMMISLAGFAQTLAETQQQNARATGYAIVASRNPGKNISIIVIPWDGTNTLEYNANNQLNSGWHAQAAIKGNYFDQAFDGNNFTAYSSVVLNQADFDLYKHTGTQWWIVCSPVIPPFSNSGITISDDQNVGIGTTTPKEKLSVNGKIRAHEIKVETANWPDYVFEDDYKIASLTEIEKYIKQNKHLPEMPSAKEVEANGLQLGEMNKLLLKKVEELTLHLIQKDKDLLETKKLMEKTKTDLTEKLTLQEARLLKIENLIK
ncbi:hypothetical protein FA048_18695 [Pedobacter polaris]|uniref:Uncharacterized protein n=1 Tax=Pedobacter polaris TaxID=2571273 RepID=A0A4U1CCU8_9SPHI|nr:hypothetical protein [Pedobacter polaris]TKC04716.1 hypothetical protein FA048_18695 [Pedobacter polaris]